jgi:drug/metabolite transporter (DMT)-like permease
MGRMARGQEALTKLDTEVKVGLGAVAALLISNVALSFGSWFVRMSDVGPVAAAWWRMGLALPILFVIAAWVGRAVPASAGAGAEEDAEARHRVVTSNTPRNPAKAVWISITLCGLFFAADLASWHLGIYQTKLANANLLGNAASFLFPIYGFVIAKSWPSRTQGLALSFAALGAVLLMGRSYELSSANLIGDLLCLLAGIFYMIFLIFIDRIRGSMGPWPLLAWTTLASAVPLLIAAIMMGERIMPGNWTPLILLATGSQLIGQGLLLAVIGRFSPLVIGLALLLQPIISACVGFYAYGEIMSPLDWVGAGLIALALLLVSR